MHIGSMWTIGSSEHCHEDNDKSQSNISNQRTRREVKFQINLTSFIDVIDHFRLSKASLEPRQFPLIFPEAQDLAKTGLVSGVYKLQTVINKLNF